MIKFLDLQKINQQYEVAFEEKLKAFMQKGWYILGDEVKAFETNFANYCGTKYCIGVGNGLDALVLIFKAYIQLGKIKKGDEIIVPANTYIASILAILEADLVPVLVEPILETYNLDPRKIQEKITPKTKAILAVHLYGQLADMNSINEIAVKVLPDPVAICINAFGRLSRKDFSMLVIAVTWQSLNPVSASAGMNCSRALSEFESRFHWTNVSGR